jgi:hypothetical protein
MTLNDQLEMWREAVVTYLKAVLCQYHVGLLIVLVVFLIRDVSFVGSTPVFALLLLLVLL